tara:strand:+ start:2767 stop:3333 length:567 start_codon:yes stop_codon:yes gene_type:complete
MYNKKYHKAAFIDRDGVINIEKNYVYKIDDFELIEGVFEAILILKKLGYKIIIITNQAGIAHGYFTLTQLKNLHNHMLNLFRSNGIEIDDIYFCPYHPKAKLYKYRKSSNFRKPNPGMILKAELEHNIDLKKSILIGDKMSDVEAGIRAGIGISILVRSGHKLDPKTKYKYICDNLFKASLLIKSMEL